LYGSEYKGNWKPQEGQRIVVDPVARHVQISGSALQDAQSENQ
jgi:hypothetical protein